MGKQGETEQAKGNALTKVIAVLGAIRGLSDDDMKQLTLLESGELARKELNDALVMVDKVLAGIKERCANPSRNLASDTNEIAQQVDLARTKLNRLQFWKRM